ncbi:MAG TPA: CHRD domain-containing protein [Gaiellaceae bacterium]|nr:CHRD domain-containing protein [Gaiellaceae bacterium]
MTRRRIRLAVAVALGASLAAASLAVAATRDHGKHLGAATFRAHLTGYEEVPAINSPGQGDVTITVGQNQLSYTLAFSGITPSVAHVHVGQQGVSGGVSFFLCGGGGKPACTSGLSGTVAPGDVQAIGGQGFAAGDLNAVIAAMRAGVTYANMHTAAFPAGEIRGQLLAGHARGHGHDGDDD